MEERGGGNAAKIPAGPANAPSTKIAKERAAAIPSGKLV